MNQESPTAALDAIIRIARQLGENDTAADALALAERTREGRYFVACVGQFKRGKSTLLNALLGTPLLPVGSLPITGVPTVVRFGRGTTARIRASDNSWRDVAPADVSQYVSEEHNPGNALGISVAEIFVASPLLADGMCLVDTPGLGSVFPTGSTATREFLPHIDAAIVVLGADPPITGDELELIAMIAERVPDLLFVLNKADRVPDEERERAKTFARAVIAKRIGRDPGPILVVSAADAQAGRPTWEWAEMVLALEHVRSQSGPRLARAAVDRGVARFRSRLVTVINEHRAALTIPLDQSRARLEVFERLSIEAERAGADLAPLLAAEATRLAHECARRKAAFLSDAQPRAQRQLAQWLSAARGRGAGLRVTAMRHVQQIVRGEVSSWLEGEQRWAEEAYRKATARFAELTRALVSRLTIALPTLPTLLEDVEAVDAGEGFTERSHFYFHEYETRVAPASPQRVLADALRGLFGLRRGIERDALAFVAFLLELNATRVESDLNDRVAESRRRFEIEVKELFRRLAGTARHALADAAKVRAVGQTAVDAELKRLESLRTELETTDTALPA